MTMILQLLVVTVAVGLGVDGVLPPPTYKEDLETINQAFDTLENNVLSMRGNIPLLNDYRRHYAEIVHVILYHGITEHSCTRFLYYTSYPRLLNVSAPAALNHPEEAIANVLEIQYVIYNEISEITQLIDACVEDSEICNELIADTVKENKDQYKHADKIFKATARAAEVFNSLNGNFEKWSKSLLGHVYVSTKSADFIDLVGIVGDIYRAVARIPEPLCTRI